MLSVDNEEFNENLVTWTIESLSPKGINLKLNFDNPEEISQGESPDRLVIQA